MNIDYLKILFVGVAQGAGMTIGLIIILGMVALVQKRVERKRRAARQRVKDEKPEMANAFAEGLQGKGKAN